MARRITPTKLVYGRWQVPTLGGVRVVRATPDVCEEIDAAWPPLRLDSDGHRDWRWGEIVATLRDAFVLVGTHPVAIWGSTKAEPIRLPSGRYYRLDFIEARPDQRGKGSVGLFAMALVAVRAMELGASGVVLAAFDMPQLLAFYERLGATRRIPTGWTVPKNLVPFVLDADALERLARLAHAHDDDQGATQEGP